MLSSTDMRDLGWKTLHATSREGRGRGGGGGGERERERERGERERERERRREIESVHISTTPDQWNNN